MNIYIANNKENCNPEDILTDKLILKENEALFDIYNSYDIISFDELTLEIKDFKKKIADSYYNRCRNTIIIYIIDTIVDNFNRQIDSILNPLKDFNDNLGVTAIADYYNDFIVSDKDKNNDLQQYYNSTHFILLANPLENYEESKNLTKDSKNFKEIVNIYATAFNIAKIIFKNKGYKVEYSIQDENDSPNSNIVGDFSIYFDVSDITNPVPENYLFAPINFESSNKCSYNKNSPECLNCANYRYCSTVYKYSDENNLKDKPDNITLLNSKNNEENSEEDKDSEDKEEQIKNEEQTKNFEDCPIKFRKNPFKQEN